MFPIYKILILLFVISESTYIHLQYKLFEFSNFKVLRIQSSRFQFKEI